jgi:hypothetical protein
VSCGVVMQTLPVKPRRVGLLSFLKKEKWEK